MVCGVVRNANCRAQHSYDELPLAQATRLSTSSYTSVCKHSLIIGTLLTLLSLEDDNSKCICKHEDGYNNQS